MYPGDDVNRGEGTTFMGTVQLGEQPGGMEGVLELNAEQTQPRSSAVVQLKNFLAFYVSDIQKSKQCIFFTLTNAPSPSLKLGHLTADMSVNYVSAHQRVILTRWHVLRSVR